jgi:hypothetical protein
MVCLGLLNVALNLLAGSRLSVLLWLVYSMAGVGYVWTHDLQNEAQAHTRQ